MTRLGICAVVLPLLAVTVPDGCWILPDDSCDEQAGDEQPTPAQTTRQPREWEADPAMEEPNIMDEYIDDDEMFPVAHEVQLRCESDPDFDTWYLGEESDEEWDQTTETWDAPGSWKNGVNVGDEVTWITPDAPQQAEVKVTLEDEGELPPGDIGTRDDETRFDSVEVWVADVDLNVDEVLEEDETEVGAFIRLNRDDDDENETPDKDDPGTVTGEDDLVAIAIWYGPDHLNCGQLELSASEHLKVWEEPTKGTEVELPKTWALGEGEVPETLYVEGVEASQQLRDAEVELRILDEDEDTVCVDTVKVTVVDLDLKEVSFSGTKYHQVRKDDNSADYSAPHWQDNSSPLDGDADDDGDHKYPVCFTRNTKMKTSVKIIAAPTAAVGGTVTVRGDGPEAADIPETVATVNGNEVSIADVEASEAFPNEVKRYNPLRIYWEICCADGGGWVNAGKSENEGFITLADPACSPPFRTVLHLACKNGGTDENSCLTNTWSSFSGPANVRAWHETRKDYGRYLYYYQQEDGHDNYYTTGLLADADGQCHAWAHLFKECLLANNVQNVMKTRVEPYGTYNRFGVKNLGYTGVSYPTNPPWLYAESDLDTGVAGIPGQNMSTPQLKLFAQHWLVRRAGDATYYDPSYGITTTGPQDFTTQAVEAWEQSPGGPWRKASSQPSVEVTFTDMTW